MSIDGVIPCPDCGARITTWQGRMLGRRFDTDNPLDPYKPHRCNPRTAAQWALTAATLRQTIALERFTEGMENRQEHRPVPMQPAAHQNTNETPIRPPLRVVPPQRPTSEPGGGIVEV